MSFLWQTYYRCGELTWDEEVSMEKIRGYSFSVFQVTGPLVAVWNDYVRSELKYENDLPYTFLSIQANRLWKWGSAAEGYVNVAETLGLAMSENRSLKVFIASGFYDLDTAYYAVKYIVNHLNIDPTLRDNITLAYYEAGHQMYTHLLSLKRLTG